MALRRGLADRLPEVVRGPRSGEAPRVLARAGAVALDPADISLAEPWSWTDTEGLTVHGLLHQPRAAGVEGPEGELPPLLVMVHGGPDRPHRGVLRDRRPSSGRPAASRCCT